MAPPMPKPLPAGDEAENEGACIGIELERLAAIEASWTLGADLAAWMEAVPAYSSKSASSSPSSISIT